MRFLIFGWRLPILKDGDLTASLLTVFKIFCGATSDRPSDGFFELDRSTNDRLLSETGYELATTPDCVNGVAGMVVLNPRQSYGEDFLFCSRILNMRGDHLKISGENEKAFCSFPERYAFRDDGQTRIFPKNTRQSLMTSFKLIKAGYYEKRNYYK